MSERREQIQSEHPLTKTRRGQLLDVARSSAYYCPEPVSEEDLMLMRLIDEIHLRWPFYGSRRIRDALEEHGHWVNRKRVQRRMRLMDLRALYPRRRTSQPGKGHKIYPYLLRGLTIDRPDQVWATDITYVPMAKGFMYRVAILDWKCLQSAQILRQNISHLMRS
jgi:putative transposase